MADDDTTAVTTPDPAVPPGPAVYQQPVQLAPPTQSLLGGSNWARNLSFLAGDMGQAMNARTGSGHLLNTGASSLGIGLANAYRDQTQSDKQNAAAQFDMARTMGEQLTNAGLAVTNRGLPYDVEKKRLDVQNATVSNAVARQQYNFNAGIMNWPLIDENGKMTPTSHTIAPESAQSAADPGDPASPHYVIKDESIRTRMINKAIAANDAEGLINPQVLYSLVNQESGWRPNVTAPTTVTKPDGTVVPTNSTATGLGQMTQTTAKGLGVTDFGTMKDGQSNLNATVKYLKSIATGAGITAADINDPQRGPGNLSFILSKYHGPTDALGVTPQMYVQGIQNNLKSRMPAPAPPSNGSVQVAGPGAPTDTPATATPPTPPPLAAGSAPARPLAPAQIPSDPATLTRMYLQGRLPMSSITPDMGAVIGNTLQMMKHPSATQMLDYATAGQKAGSVKQAEQPYLPAGRPIIGPDKSIYQAPMGGGTVQKVVPADTAGIGAAASAEAQGSKTGSRAGELPDKLITMGQKADASMANIDIGLAALDRSQKEGITPGYFAPWYATGAAIAKNLGIEVPQFKPGAVADAQLAQKTLGIVSGAILQSTVGDSQITDAKIAHFIHTQPDLATDPQAIQKILSWARNQFQYEHNMAMDGMSHIDPASGSIPPGWQASYYAKQKAFAPIYDPLTQETKQPNGQSPPTESPAPSKAETPKSFPEPNMRAANGLKDHPERAAEYDAKFGPGAAAKVLAR